MKLQPLQAETLLATQQVAAELFPWEHEHQLALPAALHPQRHAAFFAERGLASVRCWTMRPAVGAVAEVAGLATLYGYQAQPEELWLAWFGITPRVRGRGIGSRLLDWVIQQARNEGRRTLRLWTTDEAEYAAAVGLYTQRGFKSELAPALPGEDWRTLVLSLGLDGRDAVSWAAVPGRRELCGREAPTLHAAAA